MTMATVKTPLQLADDLRKLAHLADDGDVNIAIGLLREAGYTEVADNMEKLRAKYPPATMIASASFEVLSHTEPPAFAAEDHDNVYGA